MSLFDKKKVEEKKPTTKKKAKSKGNKTVFTEEVAKIDFSDNQMIAVEKEYDFKDMDIELKTFVKYFILNGGNGTAAYYKMRGGNITMPSAHVGANRYLRRLRANPDFWDLMGLGYNNLREVIELLKITKPEKAADIIMRVNKEDSLDINVSGKMTIEFEKGLDD